MIKGVLDKDGEAPTVMLGLSRLNLERLQEGKPILVQLEELGMGRGKIAIFFGETEDQMIEDLKKAGIGMGDNITDHRK